MTPHDLSSAVLKLPVNLTLCGLGGCGKRMVGEICSHEWFLNYYSQENRNLQIYTMDTDATEKDQDERRCQTVLNKAKSLGGQGRVKYSSLFLPGIANVDRVPNLASTEIVNKIKGINTEPKASVWWLNDPDAGLKFNDLRRIDPGIHDDFSGGVHRRRAISKAIFYKVISEGQASGFPMFSNVGTNAIVVGLGGGTGSGMFIDLARYIREHQAITAQIWLFVILPTTNESDAEQVNAAIALTELEYINQGERLFNNIVLTSLGPTGYKKGEEARREVRDFDAAFPYIFTNFFQIERGDLINISDVRKPYSSFILADAHIISYPVEELRSLKKGYEEVINGLNGITEARKSLNQIVSSLREDLTRSKHRDDFASIMDLSKGGKPTREDFDYIKKEYGNIEKVWSHDIGRLLGYQTNEGIEYYIHENIPEESRIDKIKNYDGLLDLIRSLINFDQHVKEGDLKDDTDKRLLRLIPESLRTLETTAMEIKKLAGVQEETVRAALIECLKGREGASQRVHDLKSRASAVQRKIDDLEAESDSKKRSIEELEERKKGIEDIVKSDLAAVDPHLREYIDFRGEFTAVKDREVNLEKELEGLFAEFRKREKHGTSSTWLNKTGVTRIQGNIASLKTHTKSLPLDDLSTLIEEIGLYYYYDMRIRQIDDSGFGSKLVGAVTGRPQRDRKKFLENKENKKTFAEAHAGQWNISFSPSSFEPSISANFLSASLESRLKRLKESIMKELSGDTAGNDISPGEISAIFEDDDLKIRASLKEALISQKLAEMEYEAQLADLTAELSNLERQCDKCKATLELIGKVIDSVMGSSQHRHEINQHYDGYFRNFTRIKDPKGFAWKTEKRPYSTTFGDINPEILSLIRDDSTLADLDNDDTGQRELDKLVGEIEATYNLLIDNHKLGANNLMISITDTESWCFGKGGLIISSPSQKVAEKIMNVSGRGNKPSENINDNINTRLSLINKSKDSCVAVFNYARPWEIALTFFAATGFLDNISPLIAGGGYRDVYERKKDNILHHVLLMNEGKYITRKRFLDLKEAGKLANSEKNDEDISEAILDLYEVKDIREVISP